MKKTSVIFGLFFVLTVSARAASDPTDPSNAVLPPTLLGLSGGSEQQIANIFTSCTGGLNASIQQAGSQMQGALTGTGPGGYVGINSDCRPLDNNSLAFLGGVDPSSMGCDQFMAGGSFNKVALDQYIKGLNAANVINNCKKAKAQAAQGELKCLTNSAQILDQQMSQLQESYTQAIQRNQTAVSQLNAIKADREAQQIDVRKKLGGDSDSGKTGLKALLAASQAMVGGMDVEVQQVDDFVKANVRDRGDLAKQMQDITGAETGKCFFKSGESKYLCDTLRPNEMRPDSTKLANCPAGSACDYMLCRFWENQHIVGGQNRGMDATVQANAITQSKILAGIFSRIEADLPSMTKLSATADESNANRDKFNQFQTAAQIEARYGAELSKLDGKGLDVHGTTIQIMSDCYAQANYLVSKQRSTPGTSLYDRELTIAQHERTMSTNVNQLLTRYQSQWTDNMAGLTGANLPIDVSLCRRAAADVQVGCLRQFRGNMQALIDGTPANGVPIGGVQMLIAGTKPQNNISFTCQGLKGCITALENVNKNVGEEVRRVKEFKDNYVLQSNNSVDSFTKRVAGMLAPQMRQMDSMLKEINASLGSLGASGVHVETKKGKSFQKDKDGLYVLNGGESGESATIQELMAGVQPYLDVKGNDFSDSMSSVGEAIAKIDEKQGKNSMALSKLNGLENQCKMKFANEQLPSASALASTLSDCVQNDKEYCVAEKGKNDPIWDVMNTWNDTNLGAVAVNDISTALDTGHTACEDLISGRRKEKGSGGGNCTASASKLRTKLGTISRSLAGITDPNALDAKGY